MPLSPTNIFKNFQKKTIDKSSTINLLISILEDSDNLNDRLKTLEVLEKLEIKDIKLFKVLEKSIGIRFK